MPTTAMKGEVALWRAVIDQAISDATLGRMHARKGRRGTMATPGTDRLADLRRAREWLTGMGRDFREVCELALLDPQAVTAAARNSIAAFDAAFPRLVAPRALAA